MTDVIPGRYMAAFALLVVCAAIYISLRKQNRSPSPYSFTDLLLGDDGKASPSRHVLFGAFFITSWIVVWGALSGHLTEVMFGAYLAAWVAPAVSVIFAKK